MCFTESQAKLTAATEDHVILALQAFKLARELVSLSSLNLHRIESLQERLIISLDLD